MIAVLIDSRRTGASSWVAVRDSRRVRISGMNGSGDAVRIHFNSQESLPGWCSFIDVDEDCEMVIPNGQAMVKAEHVVASGECRVFVDLVR